MYRHVVGLCGLSPTVPVTHPRSRLGACSEMLGQMYCMTAMQAMKINAKINGINHKLSAPPFAWMTQPYIVIGTQCPASLSVVLTEGTKMMYSITTFMCLTLLQPTLRMAPVQVLM